MKNFILFISAILLFSCSDKLSKEEAEKMIKACPGYSNELVRTFEFGNDIPFIKQEHYQLRNKGLINIDSTLVYKSSVSNVTDYDYDIEITPKGKEYLIRTTLNPESIRRKTQDSLAHVKVAEVDILSIDEIQEVPSENIANVRVTLIQHNYTPFESLLITVERERDTIKGKKPIVFRKTNDGWRVCKD